MERNCHTPQPLLLQAEQNCMGSTKPPYTAQNAVPPPMQTVRGDRVRYYEKGPSRLLSHMNVTYTWRYRKGWYTKGVLKTGYGNSIGRYMGCVDGSSISSELQSGNGMKGEDGRAKRRAGQEKKRPLLLMFSTCPKGGPLIHI